MCTLLLRSHFYRVRNAGEADSSTRHKPWYESSNTLRRQRKTVHLGLFGM